MKMLFFFFYLKAKATVALMAYNIISPVDAHGYTKQSKCFWLHGNKTDLNVNFLFRITNPAITK